MASDLQLLNEIYSDTKTCAKLVGLSYVEGESEGITRHKRGKGFSYQKDTAVLTDKNLKQRIIDLVIPPAWKDVWICPKANGHVLATGIDEQGRKQYIYHPKWRMVRDLLKFYRMIVFARALPQLRSAVDEHIQSPRMSRESVISGMLWILDNTYIRIGNDRYYELNESVGLTTMTDKNVLVAGPVVTFAFKGKSGKQQQMSIEHPAVAKMIQELQSVRGARLFRYKDADGMHEITASHINTYLHELTGTHISAKDFRTWGGTLLAFDHLVTIHELPKQETPKNEKVVVKAIDKAASILGNTRAVARSSYVHPHVLQTYGTKNFQTYYDVAAKKRKIPGLDKRESELLYFLEQLFEEEFQLLKQKEA